ncbi:growth arrest-specific protein 1-like isoform X2 [Limulus polyphemus]|uniref:Growth arrest-specific protein 1-like isoform X2 n=1 Tax=Limulus polyphemus TaxID=6850 RepID=A0ABM1TNW3_LIMPO|nr:growth arrest-specific protein 1-like isoform X2 [Limulus polyphemus]
MHFMAVIVVAVVNVLPATFFTLADQSCEEVQTKCASREGCGTALRRYMVHCAGQVSSCPTFCKRALISLTSTPEGREFMMCDCNGSEDCQLRKQRVEICRPEVIRATAEDAVVSCSVAHWICVADLKCSKALEYYIQLCHGMFSGYKCTHRCNNSLAILNRQDKAEKLRTCYCDGSEEFPCRRMKVNMERLCYGREDFMLENTLEGNEISHFRSSAGQLKCNTWSLWYFTIVIIMTKYAVFMEDDKNKTEIQGINDSEWSISVSGVACYYCGVSTNSKKF